MKSNPLGFIALILLSLICAFTGLGLSYYRVIIPNAAHGELKGISGDGWIQDGAQILLSDLAPRGNRLVLKLDPGPRPASSGVAELDISLCAEAPIVLPVSMPADFEVSLRGDCEPRTLTINVKNPYIPSDRDQRKLGVQLRSATISSRLGLPIVRLEIVAMTALAILSVALLLYVTGSSLIWRLCAFLTPLLAAVFITNFAGLDLGKPYALWIFSVSLAFGFCLAAYLGTRVLSPNKRSFKSSISEDERQPLGMLLLAALISVLGGALRIYGLSFGLPSNFHPDEVPKVNAIMRMVENGDLNPRYFLHPSLLLYCTYFLNKFFHLVGMEGSFRETAFLAGRTVSAIGGTLSIFLTYCIGRRIFTAQVGLLAAALLAVFPLHVTCSRYMKEDALLLFFVLAASVAMLKGTQERKSFWIFVAAFLCGCSASVKYSGLVTGALLLTAPWIKSQSLEPDSRTLKIVLCALPLVAFGFLICSPYIVLDYPTFRKDFGSEAHHMLRGHTTTIDAWSQLWMYHLSRSIIPGTNLAVTMLAIVGVAVLLYRRRVEDLFVIYMILMFYLPAEWVKAKPAPQPERYILPCLPFLALALAELMRITWRSSIRMLVPIVTIVAVFLPLKRSLALASEIHDDTRDRMAMWMDDHLQHGASVLLDWKPYAPRFFQNEFNITYVPRAYIMTKLEVASLRSSGQDYLVLSSLWWGRYCTMPNSEPAYRQQFRDLFTNVPIVYQVESREGAYGFHNPTLTLFSLKPEDFARLDEENRKKAAGEISQTQNDKIAPFDCRQSW